MENRPVLMTIEERPVRHENIDRIENIDTIKIYKGILKLTTEVNELEDLITIISKICVSKAESHTEGSETLNEIFIRSAESFEAQCNFNGLRRGQNQKHSLKGSVIAFW